MQYMYIVILMLQCYNLHQVMQVTMPTLMQADQIDQVVIPNTEISLSEICKAELENTIDPLRPSNYNGVDIYFEVLQFLHARLPDEVL